MEIIKHSFKTNNTEGGRLMAINGGIDIPFDIARIFIVEGSTGEVRGDHAHKICRQLIICIGGRVELTLDNGKTSKTYHLTDISEGILIESKIWATQKYLMESSKILVICDTKYDQNDYLRNYQEYLEYINLK